MKFKNTRVNIVLILFVTFLFQGGSVFSQKKEKGENMDEMWGHQNSLGANAPDSRTKLFDDGNYAMFIHWGIYSKIANTWKDSTYYGISEWIMNPRRANIPVDEYMAEAKTFDPVNFDAMAIAQLAKDAGMKYIVVTSKHHDGFAMYNSKSNDFNIVKATPFARDPMKELSKACKELGLGFGFYYSHNQDWTFPGGNGGPKVNEKGKEVGFDYYFKEKCLPQVKEIVTQYGDIAMVWFDTPGNMEKKYVEELVEVVRKHQPNAMISGRAGHGLGDYKSLGDMNIPIKNIGGLWETVDVTNDSWGYAWYDQNWKSPKRILKSIISTVARGGTYMLNVGPAPDGTIPAEAQESLRASGEWISKYPQVVYKTGASPWGHALPWGDATVAADGKLNLCVYQWPLDGKLWLPGLKNTIKSADLLVDGKGQKLETTTEDGWVAISLPARRNERLISVIELEIEGSPEVAVSNSIDPVFSTVLPVDFATAEGCAIAEKRWMEKFGEWKHIEQAQDWKEGSKVTWEIEVKDPGYYQTELNYAGEGRLVWNITSDEGVVVQNQQNSSEVYSYYEMGLIKFNKPGKHTITVSLVDGKKSNASLKEIRLTPEGSME
ncbi:alpha-L-fucosidase [Zobellia barbeyronii]|uniref:alpha-L-fucosidase n=1 Tax=Zobellia barbeyronii TaxID=2748009 RepID=A0ABS5WDQ3_9FLAO|nr:alpha-L-fucosidase [Zobellia barbeyronii]MBT2161520.1 alpha-L-fucosidase [Zobellia barbeyronii]